MKTKILNALDRLYDNLPLLDIKEARKDLKAIEVLVRIIPDDLASKSEHHKLIFDYNRLQNQHDLLRIENKRLRGELAEALELLASFVQKQDAIVSKNV